MPLIAALGVTVFTMYCLMDVLTSDRDNVRFITKFGWAVVVVLVPIVGGGTWLAFGRPRGSSDAPSTSDHGDVGASPPRGPDDDPEFLREIEERLRRRDR